MKTRKPSTGPRNPVIRAMLQNPSRAIRRHEDKRAKAEAKRQLAERRNTSWGSNYPDPTPKEIGKAASTHLKACSCFMCQKDQRVTKARINADTYLQEETMENCLAQAKVEQEEEDAAYWADFDRRTEEQHIKFRAQKFCRRRYANVPHWVEAEPDKYLYRCVVDDVGTKLYDFEDPYEEKLTIRMDINRDRMEFVVYLVNPDEWDWEEAGSLPMMSHSLDQAQAYALLLYRLSLT